MLTIIGYRFGHHSGLDESSGRNPTALLHEVAFRVCLLFSRRRRTNTKYLHILIETDLFQNGMSFLRKKTFAASLKHRNWGLGIPIHIKMQLILISMPFIANHISSYTQLVSNRPIVLPLLLSLLGHSLFKQGCKGGYGFLLAKWSDDVRSTVRR